MIGRNPQYADIPTVSTQEAANEEYSQPSDEETASYLVNYFYESINSGDYVTAYSLLGSSWKEKTDFSTFRNGYLHTTSVTIDDLHSNENWEIHSRTKKGVAKTTPFFVF